MTTVGLRGGGAEESIDNIKINNPPADSNPTDVQITQKKQPITDQD